MQTDFQQFCAIHARNLVNAEPAAVQAVLAKFPIKGSKLGARIEGCAEREGWETLCDLLCADLQRVPNFGRKSTNRAYLAMVFALHGVELPSIADEERKRERVKKAHDVAMLIGEELGPELWRELEPEIKALYMAICKGASNAKT